MRRLISFAGSTVALGWVGEDAAAIATFLFSRIPSPASNPGPPVAQYHCGPGAAPGRISLVRDGVLLWEGENLGSLAEAWLASVSHDLAANSRGGMLFHAGALASPRGGIVIPAASGAGKSTLVLWLACRGLAYRSDELVFVPELTAEAHPGTRPLSLKPASGCAVRPFFDLEGDASQIVEYPGGWLIAPSRLDPAGDGGALSWDTVLFPRYAPGGPFELEPLSKARAAVELTGCFVNARNLPEMGFPSVARLAAAAPAYRLRYSSFDQLGPLEKLLGL